MLLYNAFLQTMDEQAGDIPSGYIQLEKGRILGLGAMEQCPPPGQDDLDLQGKTVLPGFVDAHSHIGLMEDGLGVEGDDINEESDPSTPHLRAIDGINPFDRCFAEAREAGVTCAVVSPGSANPLAGQICAVKTQGRWVDQMAVAQPLAIKFALGENPKMSYGGRAQTPVTRMATAAIIREQLYKAKRYWADKQAADEDPDRDGPDYDMRCEALIPLLNGEIQAHFHAHRAYDILSALRIAHEFGLRYAIVHCTEGHLIADILAEQKVSAICGPLMCARTKPELSGLRLDNCTRLMEAGVTVAISTDHPEVPVGLLASSAALAVCNGLPPEKALQSITIAAARAVGLEARLGSLTPGKDADLTVFSTAPLALGTKPDMVFIDGKRVV